MKSSWLWLLFFLVIILILIYKTLKSAIHRIFGLDYKKYADALIPGRDLTVLGNQLKNIYEEVDGVKNSFNNTIIVGVNASHIFEIKQILTDWKTDNFFCLDLLDLPNLLATRKSNYNENQNVEDLDNQFQVPLELLFQSRGKNHHLLEHALNNKLEIPSSWLMIYIEHFEFAHIDIELNKEKLNILQRLVDNPAIRVVISSEINPGKIYNFYEDSIRKIESVTSKMEGNFLEHQKLSELLKVDYNKWLHLLGGFYRITVPFENIETIEYAVADKEVFKEELSHGIYLKKLNLPYKQNYSNLAISDEDLILNIQEVSYTYYFSIWNSLSKEERYIVYDIAKDKFLNTNNVNGILDLLHKGILVYDHSLRLMNESFTDFILSKVNSDEALAKELERRQKGTWNTASSVLLILILSLIVFISFGKVSILNDLNALIGSLAAVFALFLRIGGIFTFGKSANKATSSE